jgi:hypothetical protein
VCVDAEVAVLEPLAFLGGLPLLKSSWVHFYHPAESYVYIHVSVGEWERVCVNVYACVCVHMCMRACASLLLSRCYSLLVPSVSVNVCKTE